MHLVDAVGRMCVADEICVYVDSQGSLLAIPFHAIEQVIIADSQQVD
jgi:hypothetical protein